jgi:uncharacterized protein YndB with AHSA1/START domain
VTSDRGTSDRSDTRPVNVTEVGEHEIVITRSFDAPRHLVFDALTKPELVRQWLGPGTWEMTHCDIDLRVGGRWRYVMGGPDGEVMAMGGEYREIVAPERLVSTELFDEDWTGGETLTTAVLTEQDRVTTLTTTVRYSSAQARAAALATGMTEGMSLGYIRLDELLAGAAGAAT